MNIKKVFLYFFSLIIVFLLSCESRSGEKRRLKNDETVVLHQNENFQKTKHHNTLKVLTWNIQNLGQSKNTEEISTISKIINPYDIVAIQEVVAKDPRGAQKVAQIVDELNRMGAKWDYSISDPTQSPSSNMSERYAYLWKTSKVSLFNNPYLDEKLKNICIREPYIAGFKLKKSTSCFYLINFHARVHSQKPEEEIRYFINYQERLESENIIILGDFNLNETHEVWDDLYDKGFVSAIQNSRTTLKKKCKNKKYLYHSMDNIYYNSNTVNLLSSGKVDFVGSCDNLVNARQISDHLPVFIEFSHIKK